MHINGLKFHSLISLFQYVCVISTENCLKTRMFTQNGLTMRIVTEKCAWFQGTTKNFKISLRLVTENCLRI